MRHNGHLTQFQQKSFQFHFHWLWNINYRQPLYIHNPLRRFGSSCKVSSPPPASRMHLSVVSLVKGKQHGWILWCAAFLCALRRGGQRVQRGNDGEKPQQVRRDRWYLPKATKSQAHWSSWLLSKDKKALHLNYHFSYNYFKAQLCLYWYCY